jgi:galactose mutarotase-like enzyme
MNKYTITSENGQTKATIVPERGAFVSSLILPFPSGARETVFLNDYVWNKTIDDLPGGIPFLFPICGRLSRDGKKGIYLYDGKQYHLNIHGFSWSEKWEVENVTGHSVEVVLRDNANTLACYPFHFEVKLTFKVMNGKLQCHQLYKNREKEKSMPYYAGFHPYFVTPEVGAGKEGVMLNFHAVRRFAYNNSLTDIIGEQAILASPVHITNPDINEQLCILGKDKLATLTFPDGEILKTNIQGIGDAELFSYVQLYTIPSKPFFCVERWMSFPNALNTVSGVRWLSADQCDEAVFEISI